MPVNPSRLLAGSTSHSVARAELADNTTPRTRNNAKARVTWNSVGSALGTKSWQHPRENIVVDHEVMAERGADMTRQKDDQDPSPNLMPER